MSDIDNAVKAMQLLAVKSDQVFLDKIRKLEDQNTAMKAALEWTLITDEMPKTKGRVLVTSEGYKGRRFVQVARWVPKYSEEATGDDSGLDHEYDEDKDEYYWPEGWYEESLESEMCWQLTSVIAWMPLPTALADLNGGGGSDE